MIDKKITFLIALPIFAAVSGCQVQPSANTVAFSHLTRGYWQIWTMEPDGSKAKQVTTSLSDKRYPVWARKGQQLFFRTNNNRVFSFNLDTGEEKVAVGQLGLNGGVVPSPDGGKLLLSRYSAQRRDSSDLWITTLDGKNRRILTRDAGLQYDPAWSPDGRQIAYISGQGYRAHELYIMDSNGKNKRRLTKNEALELLPAFSPDGKTIAYASDVTGSYEIWLMDTGGGNPKQLTDSRGIDTNPCWSPDGQRIMFVSNRSGELQIWIMSKDGGNPKKLTAGPPSMDPAWRRK